MLPNSTSTVMLILWRTRPPHADPISRVRAILPGKCSCLENSRGGGAWWAAVYAVAQSRTRLKRLSSSSSSSADLWTRNLVQNEGLGSVWMCPQGLQTPFSVYGAETRQGAELSPAEIIQPRTRASPAHITVILVQTPIKSYLRHILRENLQKKTPISLCSPPCLLPEITAPPPY